MLKIAAKEFLIEKAPIAFLRKLRDTEDEMGYDPELWLEMAAMGWTSLTIPEEYGGLGFGYVGLGEVLEETGRTLTCSPLISTSLLCASAIQLGGSLGYKHQFFQELIKGIVYAFATDEQSHHDPDYVETKAEKAGSGFVLTGTKTFVLDGHVAAKYVVSAKFEERIHLFVVDADAVGIQKERIIMMDSRNSSDVSFEKTPAICMLSGAEETYHRTLDIGRIGLASEMLGATLEAFQRTVAYLKERRQFGVSIGSFQALQHRASKMFCEIEMVKSIVLKALQMIDREDENLAIWASMAKVKAGEVIKLVTNEAIQIYGGIGMTDDEEIGFFIKRARAAQVTLWDYNFHLDRYAKLHGY